MGDFVSYAAAYEDRIDEIGRQRNPQRWQAIAACRDGAAGSATSVIGRFILDDELE